MMRWNDGWGRPRACGTHLVYGPEVRRAALRLHVLAALVTLAILLGAVTASAQTALVRDLTVSGGDVPIRLVGYGLVVGLDGTGDRVMGGYSSGHTVRSVANLLRRFDVEVPEAAIRTRNVAAVLVTAEASPYLRPGGRFDIHVSSLGDAASLRGGVLWMTPLQSGPGSPPVATAQGSLLLGPLSGGGDPRAGETSAVVPGGGLLEVPLPRPDLSLARTLHLRRPDVVTASRIAEVINASLGPGAATVEDPGSISLQLPGGGSPDAAMLAEIGALAVEPARSARVIIDSRSGTVIAGGEITVGEAVVSHGGLTLAIGAAASDELPVPGDVRMAPGVSVRDIATALHGIAAPPEAIAAVFESLRQVGALTAEVTVR